MEGGRKIFGQTAIALPMLFVQMHLEIHYKKQGNRKWENYGWSEKLLKAERKLDVSVEL